MTKKCAKVSESAFTRWFCERLTRVNAYCVPIVASGMQQSGLPDRYVCHHKFRGWLEFKKGDGRLSEAQRLTIKSLQERGDVAFVVRAYRGTWVFAEDITGEVLAQVEYVKLLSLADPDCGLALVDFLISAREKVRHN